MGWFAPMLATMGAGTAASVSPAVFATTAATVGTSAAATAATTGAVVGAGAATAGAAAAGMTTAQAAMLGASVVGAGLSGYSTYQAGQAAKAQYKEQAKQEASSARQREIDRRRELLSALASQVASAGAMGVSTRAGTGLAGIAQYDINASRKDMLADRVNTGRSRNMLLKAGKNASTMGGIGAAASLLDSAVDIGRNGGR